MKNKSITKGKTYTAGIIGVGRIGFSLGFDKKREQPASHTATFKQNPRTNLIAACDVNISNLKNWHKYNKNATIYSNVNDFFLFEKQKKGKIPDIISIAVNESFHHEIALQAIKQQPQLIILEKPVALNIKEAEEIENTAIKYNVPILINHERRFSKDYRLTKTLIKQIGEIQSITACLNSGMRLYSSKHDNDGFYSLLHDGTHLVDIILFLLDINSNSKDKLINQQISGLFYDQENNLRNATITYSCKKCPSVQFIFSGRSKFFGFEVDIIGTLGRIKVGNGFFEYYKSKESKLYSGFRSLELEEGTFYVKENNSTFKIKTKNRKIVGNTGYFSEMLNNAMDFLDGKDFLHSTIQDGIETLKILQNIKNNI